VGTGASKGGNDKSNEFHHDIDAVVVVKALE
jgi:hypothetical protein